MPCFLSSFSITKSKLLVVLSALFAFACTAVAAPPTTPRVSFINQVAPILKDHCFACHDAKKRKGKLDMTTYESLRKGGTKDDPIVPGQPDDSVIIGLLTAKDKSHMPPKETGDPLDPKQIALIARWIQEGATLDSGLDSKADLLRELRLRWTPPAPPAAYPYPLTITALAFSPDNKKIVVGGHHEILVWDIAGAKPEKRVATRAERAYAMLFLPDGTLAVAGGRPGQEGDVRLYNLQAGQAKIHNGVAFVDGVHDPRVMVKELLETDDEVRCLAATPDGKKLAAGGCDRTIRVWDLSGGYGKAKLDQTIENHADWVFGVAFTLDGKHLLSASRDKTAKVWDVKAKESVLTFAEHQAGVYAVAVKPDGKVGVSVGEDNQVRVWNAGGEGKQIHALGGHGAAITKVLYHPRQPLVITCSADHSVRVWNADTGAPLKTMTGHTDWVYALALSPDGNLLASGSWNGEVKIWKLPEGTLVKAWNASPGLQQAAKK